MSDCLNNDKILYESGVCEFDLNKRIYIFKLFTDSKSTYIKRIQTIRLNNLPPKNHFYLLPYASYIYLV